MKAAAEAIENSGLVWKTVDRERVGVFVGGGAGGILSAEKYRREMLRKSWRRIPPSLLIPFFHLRIDRSPAEEYELTGPRATIATACSSSATAIGCGLDAVRSGEVDIAIAGGSESLSEVTFGGFNSLRAVDEEPCRPFDLNRKGLSLGEGAGFLVLEEAEHARNRGAKLYAEARGYGLSGTGTT